MKVFGWFLVVRKGDSGKAETPSGRLVLATRHVDLKAASTRAPLALCADDMTITKRGKNRTRWWFEFNLNLKERLDCWTISPCPTFVCRTVPFSHA